VRACVRAGVLLFLVDYSTALYVLEVQYDPGLGLLGHKFLYVITVLCLAAQVAPVATWVNPFSFLFPNNHPFALPFAMSCKRPSPLSGPAHVL
jgi:hypothetical protein